MQDALARPLAPLERSLRSAEPIDLGLTLAPLRHGLGDPTMVVRAGAIWRATRTPDGPATLSIRQAATVIELAAWGPGAIWAIDSAPSLLGLDDDPAALRPVHPIVRELARRMPGLRIGRTGRVLEALVPAVIEQKVTGDEARRAYRALLRRFGEPAPGPLPLVVPPSPERLASLPYFAFHPLGLERRRADTIRHAAARARQLEACVDLPLPEAYARLLGQPGVGPWTAGEIGRAALGDPDAVSIGDYHLPSLVSWALAGERDGDDARMLELLEPYLGQRARVIRLLEAGGVEPPRRGPRAPSRSISAI